MLDCARLSRSRWSALVYALLAIPAAAQAPPFDYYVLALSYAPDFCAQSGAARSARECGPGRRAAFVVHGLWPEREHQTAPEYCGGGSPLAHPLVRLMLDYFPTESLIQHEWDMHGTCSGVSATDYFVAVRNARGAVRIPEDLNRPARRLRLAPAAIEAGFAAANPRFPPSAFRITCYRDADLEEVRVCFTPALLPRPCGPRAGRCRAPAITILPVR
jgi:ribonuclease T2